jgi:hypothetical protein
MASVLDVFAYVFRAQDEGVEKKLDSIKDKSNKVKEANEKVTESFKDFASEAKSALGELIPGADRLVDVLGKVSKAFKGANGSKQEAGRVSQTTSRRGGTGGGAAPPSPPPLPAEGEGGAAGAVEGLGLAAGTTAAALTVAAVAVGVLTAAFMEGARELTESRKTAQEAGINSVQQAGAEQYAKNLRLSKTDMQKTLVDLANTTREGWVKSREFGNIFGLGNERTQLLKHEGIRISDRSGALRNSYAILDDITKKMIKMPRDAGIAFGQMYHMSKDMATAIYDSKQSLSEYTIAHQKEVQAQAIAIDQARTYEKAQQALSNAWDDFRLKIGARFMPAMTNLLEDVIKAADEVGNLVTAMRGLWEFLKEFGGWVTNFAKSSEQELLGKEGAESVNSAAKTGFGWMQDVGKGIVHGIKSVGGWFGNKGAEAQHQDALDAVKEQAKATTGTLLSNQQAEAKLKADEAKAREDFLKKNAQQTSDNNQAAKWQLEAANLMKVATARFGLSTEQYMAIWAATSGKAGGLQGSGGMTNAGFRDAYRNVVSRYATPEVAQAMYFRGAPMMSQLPTQYAMGFGVTPLGIPRNAIGLMHAQNAVQNSSMPINQMGAGATKGETKIDVKTGPITIQTKNTDPNEINTSIGNHLAEQIKYALNKLNDGQIA